MNARVVLGLAANLSVLALLTLPAACSPSSSGASAGDGGAKNGDGGGSATGSALTCPGIIDCASKCADNDDACSNACVDQGSPDAKAAVEAIVKCVETNACQDAACFQTKCPKELDACIHSGTGGGQPLTGEAPKGNVPADLVGKWHSSEEIYEFGADGTVSYFTSVKIGGCTSQSLEKGTAVAEGANLTLYFTSAAKKTCFEPNDGQYKPRTEGFTFEVKTHTDINPTLHLKENVCRYEDPNQASFYCQHGYDKE